MEVSMSSTNYKNNGVCSVSGSEFCADGTSSWSCYLDESGPECSFMFSDVMSVNHDHASPIRASFVDHDLEDTATSPVHGPEVQLLDHFSKQLQEREYRSSRSSRSSMSQAKKQGKDDYKKDLILQEKVGECNQTGQITHLGSMELRKHGLCVVPISMLFNF